MKNFLPFLLEFCLISWFMLWISSVLLYRLLRWSIVFTPLIGSRSSPLYLPFRVPSEGVNRSWPAICRFCLLGARTFFDWEFRDLVVKILGRSWEEGDWELEGAKRGFRGFKCAFWYFWSVWRWIDFCKDEEGGTLIRFTDGLRWAKLDRSVEGEIKGEGGFGKFWEFFRKLSFLIFLWFGYGK